MGEFPICLSSFFSFYPVTRSGLSLQPRCARRDIYTSGCQSVAPATRSDRQSNKVLRLPRNVPQFAEAVRKSRKTDVAESARVRANAPATEPIPNPFRTRPEADVRQAARPQPAGAAKTQRGSLFSPFLFPATRPRTFSRMHSLSLHLICAQDFNECP